MAASLGLPWAPIPSPEVPPDVSHLRSHTQHTPGHSPLCQQTAQVWISKTKAWLYPREPVSAVSSPGLLRARRHPAASLLRLRHSRGSSAATAPPQGLLWRGPLAYTVYTLRQWALTPVLTHWSGPTPTAVGVPVMTHRHFTSKAGHNWKHS